MKDISIKPYITTYKYFNDRHISCRLILLPLRTMGIFTVNVNRIRPDFRVNLSPVLL